MNFIIVTAECYVMHVERKTAMNCREKQQKECLWFTLNFCSIKNILLYFPKLRITIIIRGRQP